jgi:hypothetical protein
MLRKRLVDLSIEAIIVFGTYIGSRLFVIFLAWWSNGYLVDSLKLGPLFFCGFIILGGIHIWKLLKKGEKLQAAIFLTLLILIIIYTFYNFNWNAAKPGLL